MSRDIHDYDSLKEAYGDLLMFERFPGPVHSERVEDFVIQLKRDIREYIHRSPSSRRAWIEIVSHLQAHDRARQYRWSGGEDRYFLRRRQTDR